MSLIAVLAMCEADSLYSCNIVAFDSCLSLFWYFCNLCCVVAILWRIKPTYLLTYLFTKSNSTKSDSTKSDYTKWDYTVAW